MANPMRAKTLSATPTGAMMGVVGSHIAYIQERGWERWVEEMRRG